MNVLIVIEHVFEDDQDLRFIMAAIPNDGFPMISPVVTLEGKAPFASGNPYGVYGDACAEFTGVDKYSLNITVAECTSGNLTNWE